MAKIFYKAHIQKHSPESNIKMNNEPEYVHKQNHLEYWWNISVRTACKVPHNKPDLIIWNHKEKICTVIDFSCPLDFNLDKKTEEKIVHYGPLIQQIQLMYCEYKSEMVPIIVGCFGNVCKNLNTYLKQTGFNEKKTSTLIRRLQIASITGTVKICKLFLNYKKNIK